MTNRCSVPGCAGRYYAKGYCGKHYQRVAKYGHPNEGGKWNHGPPEQRFWHHVDKGDLDECWEWKGTLFHSTGYGALTYGSRGQSMMAAHRLSFEVHHGKIPDGMVVMHACDNPKCVNPNHLNVGTHADNVADKMAKGRWRLPKEGAPV